MKAILAIAACAFVSACAVQTRAPNGPPEWQSGYSSGCSSGYKAAGNPYFQYQKDFSAYANDTLYKQGWDEGYGACKDSYNAIR